MYQDRVNFTHCVPVRWFKVFRGVYFPSGVMTTESGSGTGSNEGNKFTRGKGEINFPFRTRLCPWGTEAHDPWEVTKNA